jgi:transposase-like protein
MKFPRTIEEFGKMFPTEAACYRYLLKVRWPKGFSCPRCGHRKACVLEKRRLYQCAQCKYQASLTARTIFHGTRTPLKVWFWAVFFFSRHKQGISALQFKKDLGLSSYQTAWSICHKVRSALQESKKFPLQGLIEADDAYVGGNEPGVHGRETQRKAVVAVAIEGRGKHAGRARMEVVEDASARSLVPFIDMNVAPGSSVATDGWKGYEDLVKFGYEHEQIILGRPERASKLLPWVHITFSNLKSWLKGTFHSVSKKHLPLYLQEFCFRLNRRWDEPGIFLRLLRRLTFASPLSYRQLVAEASG